MRDGKELCAVNPRSPLAWLAALALVPATMGCPKESAPGEAPPSIPEIDLSGVWAGTWTGVTTYAGNITGNWEADVVQGADGLFGTFTMSGDVDCMDGTAVGTIGADNVLAGQLHRYPCNDEGWTMTALNLLDRSTAGVWDQPALGSYGTFTGIQIARAGGPRIRFVNPPAAPPGSIVTIVGSGFDPDPPRNVVDFHGIPAAPPLSASPTTLTVRVPPQAATGPVYVTTPHGTALSPRRFDVAPSAPRPIVSATLDVSDRSPAPASVAIDNEGRKAYLAGTGRGDVTIVNTNNNAFVTTTVIDPYGGLAPIHGIVLSPDGRQIYLGSGDAGVTVLQSALATVIDAIAVPSGGATRRVPNGLALSPDGQTLYVSDERDGGAFRVVDLPTRSVLATVSRGGGTAPRGVATAPDGRTAYLLFAGADEGVAVFDRESLAVIGSLATGAGPLGAAVTPDGTALYVTNEQGASVTRWDLIGASSVSIPVGVAPRGIAVSPDGRQVLVANGASGTVSVVSRATDAVLGEVPVGSDPFAVSMSPDGKRAYVSRPAGNAVVELGGPFTLTVAKQGSGLGSVTSSPDGISCGPACQARFDEGTMVSLTAIAASGSTFAGWGPECPGGSVTMTESRRCTATFDYVSSGGGGGGGGEYAPVGTECFIATAAFGSPWEPEVAALRAFRDRRLLTNGPGRAFVRFYYAHSPPIARYLEEHEGARAAVRWALVPLVLGVTQPVGTAVILGALAAVVAWGRHGRRVRRGDGGTP